ncbi:MAG: phage adaptor protein [Telluria sp.]
MQLLDLINLARQELDDSTEPYLWSDAELLDYANDAELEACRRARLLVDSSTAAVTQIAVTAGTALYPLDERVLFVRRARFAGYRPLARMTVQDMDDDNPYWQDAEGAQPRHFVTDYESGSLLLWPTPTASDTLYLTVVRAPLAEMNDAADSPEIASRWHRALRYWMLYRAYGKQDAEGNDPKKAAESLALFEQEFGRKSSAIDEAWIAREQMDYDGTY